MNKNGSYKYETVMVIDDSLPDRFIAEKLIVRSLFASQVIMMLSPIEAIQYLNNESDSKKLPQIIFLDIRMPRMDGFEFLEQFKLMNEQVRNNCKIYLLTSSTYIEDKKLADSYACVMGFISKPLTEKSLFAINS